MKFVSRIAVVCFAVCFTAGSGIALAKSPHQGRPTTQGAGKVPTGVAQPAQTSTIPKRYTVVSNGPLASPNGSQTRGTATCPPLTVVWGGGVFVTSSSLAANVNSSFPNGSTAWSADVNNASGAATDFTVYAICAKQPRNGYAIVSNSVTNSAGFQNSVTATCPGTLKILGGGGFSSSGSTAVNINSTIPAGKNGWRVDMNNASGSDTTATSYAVCGFAKGRTNIVGSGVTNPAGGQTASSVSCPAGKVPSGGGEFSSSGSTAVNLNTTYPAGSGWTSYENNASGSSATTTSYVVCVGVL